MSSGSPFSVIGCRPVAFLCLSFWEMHLPAQPRFCSLPVPESISFLQFIVHRAKSHSIEQHSASLDWATLYIVPWLSEQAHNFLPIAFVLPSAATSDPRPPSWRLGWRTILLLLRPLPPLLHLTFRFLSWSSRPLRTTTSSLTSISTSTSTGPCRARATAAPAIGMT